VYNEQPEPQEPRCFGGGRYTRMDTDMVCDWGYEFDLVTGFPGVVR